MSRALAGVVVGTVLGGMVLGCTVWLGPQTHATVQERPAPAAARCDWTLPDYPELRPGDRGRAVRTLQCLLDAVGFGPVAVDGWYGPQTTAAVRRLSNGMEAPQERPAVAKRWYFTLLLARSRELTGLRPGDRGPRVRTLQRALRADGWPIVVDGRYGSQTRSRVSDFQAGCEIRSSGRVTVETDFRLSEGGCDAPPSGRIAGPTLAP